MFPNIGKARREITDGGGGGASQRPFHETIVEQLDGIMRPVHRLEFGRICWLVANTKMPTGHQKVIDALAGLAERSGLDERDFESAKRALEAGMAAAKEAKKPEAVGRSSP